MADDSYTGGVYREQGSTRLVVKSGSSLDVESGGEIDVESGASLKLAGTALTINAAEANLLDGAPASFSFSPAAGGANVCEVTITAKDAAAATLAGIRNIEIWLSDAATGAGLTSTTASGTVAAKSAAGTDLTALTAKKHLIGQTLAAGTYVLEITDTAKTGFYVAVKNPITGAIHVSSQLVTGNYG